MKASVIIPTRGGAERLPGLLSSLAMQTHNDWEAIVVIDGDIDHSERVVAEFAHLPVRSLVFPENRGRVAALNAGLKEAEGDVLLRADDDFELVPGHVAAHLSHHENGECGVVGLPRNVAPATRYMRVYGAEADDRGRRAAYALTTAERWRLWGGNVSVARSTYERLGDYDPRYRGYGWEDVDYGYRLCQAGIPIVLAQDAEVQHHVASVTTPIRVRRAFDSGVARRTFDSIHGVGTSGPPFPADPTNWNRLVIGLSKRLNRRRADQMAFCVERGIHVLPRSVGRRAIGLAVESAGVAGYRVASESLEAAA